MNTSKKILMICLVTSIQFVMLPRVFADAQSAYTEYIMSLESLDYKAFKDILLNELDEYLRRFPAASNLADMYLKKAGIFLDNNNLEEAFIAHLQILYLYPKSEQAIVAKDRLRTLINNESRFKDLRSKTEQILQPRAYGENAEEAYYLFLNDLVKLNFKRIDPLIIRSTGRFLKLYPGSDFSHEVLYWRAQLFEKEENYQEAVSEYMKLTYMHQGSIHLTASKLKMATIYGEELKLYQQAILALEEFMLEHPEDPQAPQAQLRIGEINDKRKKQYLEAINAYVAVAQKYPKSVEAVPALFEAARLYEVRFKEYDQAIRVYSEIVRDYPKDLKAPYAFVETARIYEKRLKDPLNAANVYFKVYGSYPESSIAPESLYASAEIYEKKLSNLEKAGMYYSMLAEKYPNHKLAEKSQKRAADIQKKLTNTSPASEESN